MHTHILSYGYMVYDSIWCPVLPFLGAKTVEVPGGSHFQPGIHWRRPLEVSWCPGGTQELDAPKDSFFMFFCRESHANIDVFFLGIYTLILGDLH